MPADRFPTVPTRDGLSSSDLPFLAQRSLRLDVRTARSSGWSGRDRARFLASKPRVLARLLRRLPASIPVGGVPYLVREIADVGTLQSAIADVFEMLGPRSDDLPTDAVVVDVGAHRGEFMAAVKQLRPAAVVRSFEPDPTVYADLAANAVQWPGVTPRCVALGGHPGRMTLHRAPLSVMSSLRPSWPAADDVDTIEVEVVTLDAACIDLERVDLLKIDVEGFEDAVLDGAHQLLLRSRFLLIELSMARSGASNLDVLSAVHSRLPRARIVSIGRPLGNSSTTLCQDVLLDLQPA